MKTLLASLLLTLSFTCHAVEKADIDATLLELSKLVNVVELSDRLFNEGTLTAKEHKKYQARIKKEQTRLELRFDAQLRLYKLEQGIM